MPLKALLVCGGHYHDFDFARLKLLEKLAEHDEVRTKVCEDYSDLDAIGDADLIITYTCDLRPTYKEQRALHDWVSSGGRWLALHGTNSVLVHEPGKPFRTPPDFPVYMETLGSQFLAHPPIEPYRVEVSRPDHPLVAGIEPFDADDELYLCEYHTGDGGLVPLLETRFTGDALGFEQVHWPKDEPRLVMYLHPVGEGEVLYLTLGHCRGHWDMQPLMEEYPQVERGAWELPVFHELLRRGLRWAKGGLTAV